MMKRNKAQSTFEFATLLIIIIGALLTMQVYVKRGLQGRWKAATDDVGDQYDPAAMNGAVTYQLDAESKTQIFTTPGNESGYWTTRLDQTNAIETRSGTTRVATTP